MASRGGNGRPVSRYLVGLTLATVLPAIACAALLAYHFVSESARSSRAEYEDRLHLMRRATELRLANIIEDLQLLALSPALAKGRLADFRRHAIDAVKLIGGVAIVLYERDGRQVVNSRLPLEGPLPVRVDFATERRAIETGKPQVSGLQRAVVDGQPVITIAVPVRIGGEIRYALNIGLSPAYLSSLLDGYLGEGMLGSIIDGAGLLITRRPLLGGEDLVGQPTIAPIRARLGEAAAFWIPAISRSGEPTYTSLLRSEQSGWTVNLAVPRAAIDGPLHRTIEWTVGLTILVLLLGLGLARGVGRIIVDELAGLAGDTQRLRGGVDPPRPGRIAEINHIKQALFEVGQDLATAMRQQRGLLDEINHRVKNTLMTVQSIARLSRSSARTQEQYAAAFEQRLVALSQAYNLLTANNWEGASLRTIIRQTLAPFAGSERIDMQGPDLMLAPRVALAIAAAVQELSTNAAKYGAFAIPQGRLAVHWHRDPDGLVHLQWTELDGPPVRAPERRGFGTRMIEGTFEGEAGWSLTMDFAASGLRCAMTFRVDGGEAVTLGAAAE
jgi:two-component sensor histidine kinase